MRNIMYDLQFIYDSLHQRAPVAALGGIVVLILGLIFGRSSMVLAGSFVIFVVACDFVIVRLFGNRISK